MEFGPAAPSRFMPRGKQNRLVSGSTGPVHRPADDDRVFRAKVDTARTGRGELRCEQDCSGQYSNRNQAGERHRQHRQTFCGHRVKKSEPCCAACRSFETGWTNRPRGVFRQHVLWTRGITGTAFRQHRSGNVAFQSWRSADCMISDCPAADSICGPNVRHSLADSSMRDWGRSAKSRPKAPARQFHAD